jgi:hypothetical protein
MEILFNRAFYRVLSKQHWMVMFCVPKRTNGILPWGKLRTQRWVSETYYEEEIENMIGQNNRKVKYFRPLPEKLIINRS